MQQVLDKHNQYRCMHGLPDLEWDDRVAEKAQSWADKGELVHSPESFRVVDSVALGENMAFGVVQTGAGSTKQWYQEIQYTSPYGTAASADDSTSAGHVITHYTQIVWKATTKPG